MMASIRSLLAAGIVGASTLAFAAAACAEDIDIYTYPQGAAAGRTDVLIILDNSPNWSSSIPAPDCSYNDGSGGPRATNPGKEQGTKMGIEKCALYNLIGPLADRDAFNVGFMMYNEGDTSGAYPRHAIIELNATGVTSLRSEIAGLHEQDDRGKGGANSRSLYEAYLYLTQREPSAQAATMAAEWDPDAFLNGHYHLPTANSCAKHIIFIANGPPGENTNDDARNLLDSIDGPASPPTAIDYGDNRYVSKDDQKNWMDEFARFLRTQNIHTHVVAVTGASSDGTFPNFMKNVAETHGGGSYEEASDAEDLTADILRIFNRIQAVSSVFSSASLPVSVNARGTYENQIFMGMFLPDETMHPRWFGNLKQYQFAYDEVTDSLKLVDAVGRDALNVTGGFLDPSSRSFWTRDSSFWTNSPSGIPPSPSDNPDGAIVAKGGAAQMLREANLTDQSGRRVLTCIGCTSVTALDESDATRFKTSNTAITRARLGVSTDAEATALIDWTRGADNASGEMGPGGTATVRPSIHGDVLHSRAAAVNYGGTHGVVVFYGANDGMLHAIYGAKSGANAGREIWSFVPEEHFSKLQRLRANSPLVRYPGLDYGDAANAPRDYFVDGPISTLQMVDASGALEKVYLFVGMRRGGRFLYAFDVTDPTAPEFLWKRSNASADYGALGQTWSEARIARLKGHVDGSGKDLPVLVMGGGYDPAEDADPAAATTMGNAVFVIDATSGSVVRSFATSRAVPADVSLVDSDADGYTDRAYAVDVGGNIYRIDFEITDLATGVTAVNSEAWALELFAEVGSLSKKFLYAPEVVLTRSYALVQAGTGDREKPLSLSTQDYFYTVIDTNTRKGLPADFTPITPANLATLQTYSSTPSAKGCYVALEPGEKVVNGARTIGGVTYFSTNRPTPPAAGSCTANLGEARAYAAPLVCNGLIYTRLEGGGLPPTPVAGTVDVDGELYNFLIGGADTSALSEDGTSSSEDTVVVVPLRPGDPLMPSTTCNRERSALGGCDVDLNLKTKRTKVYWYPESER